MRRLAGITLAISTLSGCLLYRAVGDNRRPKHYLAIAAAEVAVAAVTGLAGSHSNDCDAGAVQFCGPYPARAGLWLADIVGADVLIWAFMSMGSGEQRSGVFDDPVEPADPRSDAERAEATYRAQTKPCEHGDAYACAGVAKYLQQHTAGNTAELPNALRVACDGKIAHACFELSSYETTTAAKQARLVRACELKEIRGCSALERAEPDEARRLALAIRSCELDDSAACERAGFAYLEGRGVTADRAKAEPFLVRACQHNRATACRKLGELTVESPQ